MNLEQINRVYFLGIGGIGMSALARWFNSSGLPVSGYDRTETPLTDALNREGIKIHFDDNIDLIDQEVIESPDDSLVIFTPAIPKDHKELNYLQSKGIKLYKRSEVLGMITANHFTVAVAGTHGKTSTSSMIAHILKASGVNCGAFVGGIMVNYNSNLILPDKKDDCIVVVEADEFDRSFLRLSPNLAVVTAADPDHLDIYGDADHLKQSFRDFIEKISKDGALFIKEKVGNEVDVESLNVGEINNYGISSNGAKARNIVAVDGAFSFDYVSPNTKIEGLKLHFPGRHNVENALAAISVALKLKVTPDSIKSAISSYRGVKRRFEFIFKNEQITYIDDYAHHPEEIKSFLGGVRELFPNKKITAVFQPHLYTRTRDFADGFAESLQMADEVILIPIYPARELPIDGVNSEMILSKMELGNKKLVEQEDLVEALEKLELEIVATIGAGNIDQLVNPIHKMLKEKYEVVKS
ncbi:MAG: UDP-N-acetylmuramate--L-alanine ligase [Cyclobacteriaceae bacterium]